MPTLIQGGVAETIFTGAAATGSTYALPFKASIIAVQIALSNTPTSFAATIQTSIDGTTWNVEHTLADASFTTNSIIRLIQSGASFIRVVVTNAGGIVPTFTLVARPLVYSVQSQGLIRQASRIITNTEFKAMRDANYLEILYNSAVPAHLIPVFQSGMIIANVVTAWTTITTTAILYFQYTGLAGTDQPQASCPYNDDYWGVFSSVGLTSINFPPILWSGGGVTSGEIAVGNQTVAGVGSQMGHGISLRYNDQAGNIAGGNASNYLVASILYALLNPVTGLYE